MQLESNRSNRRSAALAAVVGLALGACSTPRTLSVAEPAQPAVQAQAAGNAQSRGETDSARAAKPGEPAPDADALFAASRWEEAAEAYRARVAANPNDAVAWHKLGYALHVAGRLDEAIAAHTRAATFPSQRAPSLYNLACAHALKSEKDEAFAALDGAITAGFANWATMSTDSDLQSLRSDPRYALLAARVQGEGTGKHRELDFWLGEWDVLDPSGRRIGGNVITKHERGHAIHESWTDAAGNTGQSLNFVDPSDGLWKQVWIDDKGGVVRYSGSLRDGALCFEGVHAVGPGQERPSRCTFTPQPDGAVLQQIENPDANGNWTVTFLGRYVRRRK